MGLLKLAIGVIVLAGLAMFAGGVFLVVQQQTATRAVATVSSCQSVDDCGQYGPTTECTGSWLVGGSLLDGGHVIVGDITGVGKNDVGKQVKVTISGDSARTLSLALPMVLLAIGAVTLAGSAMLTKVVLLKR